MSERSDRRGAVASVLLALGLQLYACAAGDRAAVAPGSRATTEWFEVVSQLPGREVTDGAMRRKIADSGHPWKVRERATGIEMVLVMPGEFLMGSPESEAGRKPDEGPRHRVRLTRPFYLGVTGVTQAQWQRLMGRSFKPFFDDETKPIDACLDEVQAFLAKANEGAPAGSEPLRLPTEAEWEYACRAGTTGPFNFEGPIRQALVNFNDGKVERAVVVDGKLEVEWVAPPSAECRMTTVPAGSLPPNGWGLHEMHGNLWELTADKYSPDSYAGRGAVTIDPFVQTAAGDLHTLRGGSWYDNARYCRAAARDAAAPHARSNRIGFRVARTL